MRIKYLVKQSKLYDLMQFPRLMFVKTSDTSSDAYGYTSFEVNRLGDAEYIDFIKQAQKRLAPFKEELEVFYADEFMSDYDFFSVLSKVISIQGHDDLEAYTHSVLKQSTETLKNLFVTSLILADREEDASEIQEAKKKADHLCANHTMLLQFMKDLPTEASYKWHLMMLLDDLHEAVRRYNEIMKKVHSIYDEFYTQHEKAINDVAMRVASKVNEEGIQGLNQLTQNLINPTLLSNQENTMLVSFVFPYAFMLRTDVKSDYLVWGFKMEEGFKKISSEYQSELEKRTQVFKNLGDVTRYEVLKLIASGVSSTKEIAGRLNVSSATISYHINAFLTSRVITLSASKQRKYDVDVELLKSVFEACLMDLNTNNEKGSTH